MFQSSLGFKSVPLQTDQTFLESPKKMRTKSVNDEESPSKIVGRFGGHLKRYEIYTGWHKTRLMGLLQNRVYSKNTRTISTSRTREPQLFTDLISASLSLDICFFRSYFKVTTVHGFRYVVDGANLVERLIWVGVIVATMAYAVLLVTQSVIDFQAQPVTSNFDKVEIYSVRMKCRDFLSML